MVKGWWEQCGDSTVRKLRRVGHVSVGPEVNAGCTIVACDEETDWGDALDVLGALLAHAQEAGVEAGVGGGGV